MKSEKVEHLITTIRYHLIVISSAVSDMLLRREARKLNYDKFTQHLDQTSIDTIKSALSELLKKLQSFGEEE